MKYYGSTKSIIVLRLLASIIRPAKYSKVTPDDKYTIKNYLSDASAAHSDPSTYSLFYSPLLSVISLPELEDSALFSHKGEQPSLGHSLW